jgi:protein phosphatase-4 regulatory subunit 3
VQQQQHHQSNRRVKLYRLQDDAWVDLGTGYCSVVVVDGSSQQPTTPTPLIADSAAPLTSTDEDGAYLLVTREDATTTSPTSPTKHKESPTSPGSGTTASSRDQVPDSSDIILRTKVMPYPPGYSSDDEEFDLLDDDQDSAHANSLRNYDLGGYQRQQETLIVWTDPSGEEMALSFATPVGCAEIWDFIRSARKWAQEATAISPSPSPSLSSPQPFPHYTMATTVPTKLPGPTLGNIAEVETAIRAMSRTTVGRERTASLIAKTQVIQRLIEVHEEAEDLESLDDLHALCRVMQMIRESATSVKSIPDHATDVVVRASSGQCC